MRKYLWMCFLIAAIFSCTMNDPFGPTDYDFEKPDVKILGVEDGEGYDSAVTPYIEEESGVKYTCSLNGETFTPGTEVADVGEYQLTVSAYKASNRTSGSASVSFSIVEAYDPVLIKTITPASGSTDVVRDTKITITLSGALNTKIIGTVTLTDSDGDDTVFEDDVNCAMTVTSSKITIEPDVLLNPAFNYENIRIEGFESKTGNQLNDLSEKDYYFITAGGVEVTAPVKGDTFIAGDTMNITWDVQDIDGSMKILLVKGTTETVLASKVREGVVKYTYTIPSDTVASDKYRIKVIPNLYPYIEAASGIFSIKEDTKYVTVSSPNGGESYMTGGSCNVLWTAHCSGNVKIELYKGGTFYSTLASSCAVTNLNKAVTIPVSCPAGSDYKLKITSLDDTSVYDESDNYFSVKSESYFIQSCTPASYSTGVACDTDIVITMNTSINGTIGTVVLNGVTYTDGDNCTITVSGTQIIVNPDDNLAYNTLYQGVSLSGFQLLSNSQTISCSESSYNFTTTDGIVPGVWGEYYQDYVATAAAAADFDSVASSHEVRGKTVEDQIYMMLGKSRPTSVSNMGDAKYTVRWRGYIKPLTSGNYKLVVLSDDGVLVKVDGNIVINSWADQLPTFSFSNSLALDSSTYHELEFVYYQNLDYANVALYWIPADGSVEPFNNLQLGSQINATTGVSAPTGDIKGGLPDTSLLVPAECLFHFIGMEY